MQGLVPAGRRLVRLPAAELPALHRLKSLLGNYPRMAFVVVAEASADREGGLGKLAALHDEPQGGNGMVVVIHCSASAYCLCST